MLNRWNFLKTDFYEGIKVVEGRLANDKGGRLAVASSTLNPESTEGRPWGQPLKKAEGAPLNLE